VIRSTDHLDEFDPLEFLPKVDFGVRDASRVLLDLLL